MVENGTTARHFRARSLISYFWEARLRPWSTVTLLTNYFLKILKEIEENGFNCGLCLQNNWPVSEVTPPPPKKKLLYDYTSRGYITFVLILINIHITR